MSARALSTLDSLRGVVRGRLGPAAAAIALGAMAGLLLPSSPVSAATLCTPSDPTLTGIAGLAATTTGYAAVPPEGTSLKIYLLDAKCRTTRVLRDRLINPFDPQDLAVTPDGTMWVADIGDTNADRPSIAIHKMVPGRTSATRYRLRYPGGVASDAGAMVVSTGVPIIITKAGDIFEPTGPLEKSVTGSLRKVGHVAAGDGSEITGASLSPDASKVVVRSATSAYEFDVVGGNVVAALSTGKPRVTAMPSPGGVIAYSADGTSFATTSGAKGDPIERVVPAAPSPSATAASPSAAASTAPSPAAAGKSDTGFLGRGVNEVARIMYLIGSVGVLMVVAGTWGIVRHRRQLAEAAEPMPDELPSAAAHDVLSDQTVVLPRIPPSGTVTQGLPERQE